MAALQLEPHVLLTSTPHLLGLVSHPIHVFAADIFQERVGPVLTVRDKVPTVGVVPVILSKLTKAPPPRRRRRKVSAARRRSRNPVHTLKGPRSQYLTRGRPARAATSSTTAATSPVARKLLIHAQNKGTRARAFRGVAVKPPGSGG